MAGKAYQLEIMTPQKYAYKGEVESVVAEATDGSFGVLVDHAPMLSALKFGIIHITETGGTRKTFVTSEGFFEIAENRAAFLVDTCESAEEIDVARAKEAKERAEKRLANHHPTNEEIDVIRAQAALMRSLLRLQAASRK